MADGRHFENSIISISQPRIIRFRSNLVGCCTCQFPWWTFNKNRNFANSRWRTDAILKFIFWLYLGAISADQCKIWNRDEGSHADIGHMTKTAIFANSRWQAAAILKIALSPYLSRELSDIDQIWPADVHVNSHDGHLTKIEILQIQDGGRTWKSFLAISRRHIGRSPRNLEHRWRITCRYRSRYQNVVK